MKLQPVIEESIKESIEESIIEQLDVEGSGDERVTTAITPHALPLARPLPPAGDLLTQIGNTPLLDLSSFAHELGVSPRVGVFAKAEWTNPSGSVKARAAWWIVKDALRCGELYAGRVLIDSSSGNTGIAFAMIGAIKGFPVHLVMPANVSKERKALAHAYGAKLIESDPLEGSDGAIRMVRELVTNEPDRYFYANQYNNPANWLAHYEGTGPEIWEQSEGRITHFVAGLGTTGTFVGTGRYLQERNPDIELVALQPEDELSVIEGLKYLPTAILPTIYDASLVDRHMGIDADDTWAMTRRLARKAGLFAGLSSGAAMVGAIEVASALDQGVVVTLLPDDGSKYVSLGLFDRG
jgi:cysteine synthase B